MLRCVLLRRTSQVHRFPFSDDEDADRVKGEKFLHGYVRTFFRSRLASGAPGVTQIFPNDWVSFWRLCLGLELLAGCPDAVASTHTQGGVLGLTLGQRSVAQAQQISGRRCTNVHPARRSRPNT